MRTRWTVATILWFRAIRLVVLAGCAVMLWCSTAQVEAQAKKVVGWKLDQIKMGDLTSVPKYSGIVKGTVKVGEMKADATRGTVIFSCICQHSPPHWPMYQLDWEFTRNVEFVREGDAFSVHMKFTRIDRLGSTCPPTNNTPYAMHYWGPDISVATVIPQVATWGGGGSIFGTTDGDKSRIRISPSPDNEKLGGYAGHPKSETLIPIIVLEKTGSPWSYMAIAGTNNTAATPGALYLFKAVYVGEPLPPGATGGPVSGGSGTGTAGAGATAGGSGTGAAGTGATAGGSGSGDAGTGATAGGPGNGAGGTGTPGGGSGTAGGPGTPGGQPGVTPPPWGPNEPASNVTRMTLQAGKRRAKSGETVYVPVWLLQGDGLVSMNFNLTYDAGVARTAGAVVKGNLLQGADYEANPNRPGLVEFGFVPKEGGLVGSRGTVAQVPFTAVGSPGSRTVLHLVPRTSFLNGRVPANPATIDGEILVVDDSGFIPGDLTGTGSVGMDDVLAALKMSVHLIPVNMRADIDKDGQVTAEDARLIREMVLGIRR